MGLPQKLSSSINTRMCSKALWRLKHNALDPSQDQSYLILPPIYGARVQYAKETDTHPCGKSQEKNHSTTSCQNLHLLCKRCWCNYVDSVQCHCCGPAKSYLTHVSKVQTVLELCGFTRGSHCNISRKLYDTHWTQHHLLLLGEQSVFPSRRALVHIPGYWKSSWQWESPQFIVGPMSWYGVCHENQTWYLVPQL